MTTLRTNVVANDTGHLSDHNILAAAHSRRLQVVTWPGDLFTETGKLRMRLGFAYTLIDFLLTVNTAPVGAAIVVDVNKNGTTIFTTQANRPQVAAGANNGTAAVPNVTAMAATDYLQFDIDQVGSTTAGADLACVMRYEAA